MESIPTKTVGNTGEEAAVKFLRVRGYQIIALNFRTAIGRSRKGVAINGEIDIVARKRSEICFVEVKTRNSETATPEDSVTLQKQRQITRTARAYRKLFSVETMPFRFDVISVINQKKRAPQIKHLKRFWHPDKFRKRLWTGDSRFTN